MSTILSPEPEFARIAQLEGVIKVIHPYYFTDILATAELEAMKAQRERADAALRAEHQRAPAPRYGHNTAADKSMSRPSNAVKVKIKMEESRQMLNIEKIQWNAIRMRICLSIYLYRSPADM
jgi:hypothetical protein